MSADAASVPAGSLQVLAASTSIVGNASAPLQVIASTTGEIRAMEAWSNLTATVAMYTGPDGNLSLLCYIPGAASGTLHMEKQQLPPLSKGTRISLRAVGAGAVSTGELIINFWR